MGEAGISRRSESRVRRKSVQKGGLQSARIGVVVHFDSALRRACSLQLYFSWCCVPVVWWWRHIHMSGRIEAGRRRGGHINKRGWRVRWLALFCFEGQFRA